MLNINHWWWPVNTGDKEDSPKICIDDEDDVNDQDKDVDGGVYVVDGGVDVVWVKIFATTFKWSGSGLVVGLSHKLPSLSFTHHWQKYKHQWRKKYKYTNTEIIIVIISIIMAVILIIILVTHVAQQGQHVRQEFNIPQSQWITEL